jgi:hypothetical protein
MKVQSKKSQIIKIYFCMCLDINRGGAKKSKNTSLRGGTMKQYSDYQAH